MSDIPDCLPARYVTLGDLLNVLRLIDPSVFAGPEYAATRDRPRTTPRPIVCIERR
jgi:hypothetical protein